MFTLFCTRNKSSKTQLLPRHNVSCAFLPLTCLISLLQAHSSPLCFGHDSLLLAAKPRRSLCKSAFELAPTQPAASWPGLIAAKCTSTPVCTEGGTSILSSLTSQTPTVFFCKRKAECDTGNLVEVLSWLFCSCWQLKLTALEFLSVGHGCQLLALPQALRILLGFSFFVWLGFFATCAAGN